MARKRPPLAALVAALVFAGLVYLFAWSSIFSVSAVAITGAPTPESTQKIMEIAAISAGEKLARVEPKATARRIETIDWIKGVEISRNWINGKVTIAVKPRTPAALFNGKTVDASGAIFTLPGSIATGLPVISSSDPALGPEAIALFKTLPADFRDFVASLTAINEVNFQLNLNYQGRAIKVLWGKNEKTALKIEVFNALIALPENSKISRIDLSAPHAPIVK